MSNAFGLRPTNTRRAWPSSKWVCVCTRVCVRSADFNLDYVPYENSMEMENNKNSVEHVQSGESSASVCVCVCVLSVWSTWRLQCLVSNETCCGKRLRASGSGRFGLALAILIFSIYSWVFCLDLVVAFGVWLQDITVYG